MTMIVFDRIIEYGIIFLIVFTPLAFGSVHPWAYSTMELTIYFLVMIWALKQIIKVLGLCSAPACRTGREYASTGRNSKLVRTGISGGSSINNQQSSIYNRFGLVKTPMNIPIVLFIGLVVFQLIPLPSGILKSLSPNTHNFYRMALPGWPNDNVVRQNSELSNSQPATRNSHQQSEEGNQKLSIINQQSTISNLPSQISNPQPEISAEADGQTQNAKLQTWLPISIYTYSTKTEFFKVLAYIGMFFLITNTPGIRIKRIVVIIISVGFCISLLGILQKLTGTKDIYWVRDASYATHFGPYVNRNHFAGYIGMVIPVALGLLVSRFASVAFFKNADRRSIAAEFQSHFFANLLLTFVIVIMISALFLSLSRGGILSFAVVVVAFCTLIGFTRLSAIMGRGWRIIASVLVITLVFLMWLGLDPVLNRLSNLSPGARYDIYLDTINMAKDFPVFGTGLGTFQYIYPGYKTLQSQAYYYHAHNDYLELISDSGLVGFVIVLSGFIMFFWKTLVRWWERRHYYAKGVALGGVCSVIAILAHSFTDFNLHIPANALFLSIVLGLTYNTVNLKRIDN
jgi:O-antigen ligase